MTKEHSFLWATAVVALLALYVLWIALCAVENALKWLARKTDCGMRKLAAFAIKIDRERNEA